jgi:hypothetical protein
MMSINEIIQGIKIWIRSSWHEIIALLFILCGIIFGWIYLILQNTTTRLTGLGVMGAVILGTSLLGMIIISHYNIDTNTKQPKYAMLHGDELRTAITISFISVFFGLLAYSESILIPAGDNCPCLQSITKSILDNYWLIISAIIAFYFLDTTLKKKE